jgi:hypothetical protein
MPFMSERRLTRLQKGAFVVICESSLFGKQFGLSELLKA